LAEVRARPGTSGYDVLAYPAVLSALMVTAYPANAGYGTYDVIARPAAKYVYDVTDSDPPPEPATGGGGGVQSINWTPEDHEPLSPPGPYDRPEPLGGSFSAALTSCGTRLRVSADGTRLCTDCPDGQPNATCCTSDEAIADQLDEPVRDCGLARSGSITGVRDYCLLEARFSASVSRLPVDNQCRQLFGFSASVEMLQPITLTTRPGECSVAGRTLFQFAHEELPPLGSDGDILRQDYQYCDGVAMSCPPIGSSSTVISIPVAAPVGVAVSWSAQSGWTLGATPGASFGRILVPSNPAAIVQSESWSGSPGGVYEYTHQATLYAICSGGGRVQVGSTQTYVRFRVSHPETCDGNPSPHEGGCQPGQGGTCNPLPEGYYISRPCDPAYRGQVVLFNVENVTACAVVPTSFGCMRVGPGFATTTNPTGLNGVIDNRVVDAGRYPTTCCECEPGCPSEPIPTSPCWAGGVRNGLTGTWSPNQPFVTSGECCCNPDDIITITQVDSRWESTGLTFHRFLNAPVVVRRGDTWLLPMTERVTDTSTGAFIQDVPITFGNEFDPIAPFDCLGGPWGGSVNAQGFGPGNLQIPEGFVGLHHAATDGGVRDMPCPISPTGDGNGVTVLSKNVSVTCTLFQYDGSWEWNGGPENGGSRVTHRLRLSITPAPNSQRPECSGGCGQNGNGGPAAGPGGPGAPTPFPGGPGIGGLSGGCGGCGRSGEL